jgi:hypothetical protein
MKARALIICGVVVLVLFLLVLGVGWYLLYRLDQPLEAKRHFLLHDVDYHSVSVACLDMMTQPQYKSLIGQFPRGDDPRLPPAIRAVKPFWVMVSTDAVYITEAGGFYSMGLAFQQSTTVSNAYELVFQEGSEPPHRHDILLYTLHHTNDVANTALAPLR